MEAFDRDRLAHSLAPLPPWKKLAFMALTCERMLPNFGRFASETKFGEVSILRHALDSAWIYIQSGKLEGDPDKLKRACEDQAPDTELFRSIYTSAALDAANAVAAIFDAIKNPSVEHVLETAALARDTVDLFVQQTNNLDDPCDPSFEQSILTNSLMQRELCRQREDLAMVAGWIDRAGIALGSINRQGSLQQG